MILKSNTGVDISDYQSGLVISGMSPLPRFVIIKATESILFKAKLTKDFAAQCKALGIPYGFYHFWQNVDPFKQASNFIAQVNAAGGFERIPPVLDLEVANLDDYAANIKVWLDVVEDVAGMRPILYSNKYHFDMIAVNLWFKNYDAWTAAYPADPDLWSWCPPLYSEKRARREIIWQYGSTYRYPNYTANSVDTNIATSEWLNEIGVIIHPSPPENGDTMLYGKVNTAVLNIRNAGAATGLDIGDLKQNDYIVAYRSVGGWWELKEAYRGSWTGAPVALANGTLVNNTVTPMWAKDSYIVTVPAPPVVVPPPAPVGDIQFNAILKADGSVTGTWKEI